MYGTGSVARVACAELTGIASTATRAASPEIKDANQRRTAGPETIARSARFMTPPTSLSPNRTDYSMRPVRAREIQQLTVICSARNSSTTAWGHACHATTEARATAAGLD